MSARSMKRPSVKKLHASSRLAVESAMPPASAARSRTQPNIWCTCSGFTRRGMFA
jgi:hypothetical protein